MTPYTTRTGIQIGRLYTRPMPQPDRDALRLQRALLGDRPQIDWDGIAIVVVGMAAFVGILLAPAWGA